MVDDQMGANLLCTPSDACLLTSRETSGKFFNFVCTAGARKVCSASGETANRGGEGGIPEATRK